MGDRVNMSIDVYTPDVPKFLEIFGWEPYLKEEHWMERPLMTLNFDDINYAGYDELFKAAEARLNFQGWHAAGSDYGEGEFVSCHHGFLIPQGIHYVPVHEGGHVAHIRWVDGKVEINDSSLAAALEFYRTLERFKLLTKGESK